MSKGFLPTDDVGALVNAYKGYGNALMAICHLPSMSLFRKGTWQLLAVLARKAKSECELLSIER